MYFIDLEKGVVCLDSGFFVDLMKLVDFGIFNINSEEIKINFYRVEEIGIFFVVWIMS